MQIELTHAAQRVLRRATAPNYIPGPGAETLLTTEKLLLALFEEEECRAAAWLVEAGLTLERFRVDFGLPQEQEEAADLSENTVLESAISAPPFPMGSYGVSPGTPGADSPQPAQRPLLTGASPDTYPVGPEPTSPEPQRRRPPQEPDAIDLAAADTFSSTSIFPHSFTHHEAASGIRFLLDGVPTRIGRLSPDLESVLLQATQRLVRNGVSFEKILRQGNDSLLRVTPPIDRVPLFATEHLLFALTLDGESVGRWLRAGGLDATELLEKLETLHGIPQASERMRFREASDAELPPIDMPEPEQNNALQDKDDRFARSESLSESLSHKNLPHRIGHYDRIFDAASNRAREALRVIEDYVRFIRDETLWTSALKDFRHELTRLVAELPLTRRLESRATETDIGTAIEATDEYRRNDLTELLAANFSRLQEALRTLEEFSKLEFSHLARPLEQLRYRSYILQKQIAFHREPHALLREARLYVLVDTAENEAAFETNIRELLAVGVDVLQLRDKKADDRTLVARGRQLRALLSGTRTLFIMNDRADLAVACGADGVHVGQEELSVRDIRLLSDSDLLIGVSTHSPEQARAAVLDGADYIGIGPVFLSTTKEFGQAIGLEPLEEVAKLSIPAFAIGGITSDNLPQVLAGGIRRIAVGSARSETGRLREMLSAAKD